MAGVDLLDNGVSMCQINIKGNEMLVATFHKLPWNTYGSSMKSAPGYKFW